MNLPPELHISPPLLNSANPWATTLEDLRALFKCTSTGAVTTRTALLDGFMHDSKVHRYTFFNPDTHHTTSTYPLLYSSHDDSGVPIPDALEGNSRDENASANKASLNNMGYSPKSLDDYLGYIKTIAAETESAERNVIKRKLIIVSVTGTPDEVVVCYEKIARLENELGDIGGVRLAMEVNLSCPNIPGSPPPAYSAEALGRYIEGLGKITAEISSRQIKGDAVTQVPVGIKTPPYTHAGQFEVLISTLKRPCSGVHPISFITATNTLGSCLVLGAPRDTGKEEDGEFIPSLMDELGTTSGIGGMAGTALHPLALGNVATLRRMLDEAPEIRHIKIIGVGGVEDAAGYRRMRYVGAAAVGVGTALGRRGVKVFREIEEGLEGVGW